MSQTPPSTAPRRPLLAWLRRCLQGWRLRHQLPFNFAIHLVGIPIAVCGAILLLALWPALALGLSWWPAWYWGVAAFVLGYLLQWIGHRAEGNDLGEWAAIKRLLGLPYVGIAPRWNPEDPNRL
jgi:uncharacterized membrane protein YGL010W